MGSLAHPNEHLDAPPSEDLLPPTPPPNEMTGTLEVRWFGPLPFPNELREWFTTLGTVNTSTQTDLYLPAQDPTLNVKLRDQQFQIKRRLAEPFRTRFSPRAAGRCEQWIKWSFDLADDQSSVESLDSTSLWVSVEKIRHQISIPPEEQSALSPELPTTPAATIDLELTQLDVDDDRHWTFCFETVGAIPSLVDTLEAAGPVLLDDRLPIPLSDDHSYGYIRWLQQLSSVSTRPAPEIQVPRPE